MQKQPDIQFRRDLVKVLFVAATIAAVTGIFVVNPTLSTPTVLSVIATMLLSPLVSALERRGLSRVFSIVLIFTLIGIFVGGLGLWASQSISSEWSGFKEKAPEHFHSAILKLRGFEKDAKAKYAFLDSVHPTDSLLAWGQETGRWFVDNGAALVGSILTWVLFLPPLTFVMLSDGRSMRRRLYHLVPNRYFEAFFLVSTDITTAISDYLRAKLVEAFLVGLMTTIGLVIVKAPYAVVLGVLAGLTNIVPYVGPVIGAAPALLVAAFDTSGSALLWPVAIVYIVANVIDTIVIFPVVVASLVKLHPFLLIAVVAIGQQYYGLVGMLISIPIATAIKVVVGEIYTAIYENRVARGREGARPTDEAFEETFSRQN